LYEQELEVVAAVDRELRRRPHFYEYGTLVPGGERPLTES